MVHLMPLVENCFLKIVDIYEWLRKSKRWESIKWKGNIVFLINDSGN